MRPEVALAGDLDAGLVRAPVLRDDLQRATVWEEPLVAVLSDDHPLATVDVLAAADLAWEGIVLFPRERGSGLFELAAG